ncbi:glucan 1,3-beta-glucosidase [Planoprotostelium fungivorum]|uniref:glucan endo-1,3-beta-D-glucosidase n=1 Tax=Planoprotostelium fungivorum TaxID=1890364 RepID=A0A2P6N3U3_9EUKA|nr:glucan 1,3-beta-glucosidase [Planoprotostelium fungivorum]
MSAVLDFLECKQMNGWHRPPPGTTLRMDQFSLDTFCRIVRTRREEKSGNQNQSHKIKRNTMKVVVLLCLLSLVSAQLRGVNYGIQRSDGSCTNYDDKVLKDFNVIATFAQAVKIYNLGYCNGAQNSLRAANATGLKVFLGMEGYDVSAYNNEKIVLQQLYQQFGFSNVLGISIGSEDLYRNCGCADRFGAQITEVQNILKGLGSNAIVPVTHTDVYYMQPPAITNVADIIMFNAFSFWEGADINSAVQTFIDHYNSVKNQFPGKPVWVGETGWPVKGASQANAVPSVENARQYLNGIVCWANANGVPYFYFEAFDESWKASQVSGDIETSFGLYNADRSRKSFFQLNCPGATQPIITSSVQNPPSTTQSSPSFTLSLYWSFDSPSSTVQDLSGNNHYGTVVGSSVMVPGKVNGAASLTQTNGLNTYLVNGGQDFFSTFTVLLWVNIPQSLDVRMKLVSSKMQWDADTGFQIEFYPTEKSISFVGAGGSVAYWGGLPVVFGEWFHVAVVNNAGNVVLYLNGQAYNAQGVAVPVKAREQLYIGSDNTPADGVTGYLDELYVYSSPLSAAQGSVFTCNKFDHHFKVNRVFYQSDKLNKLGKLNNSSTTSSQVVPTGDTCGCGANLSCCNGQCYSVNQYVCASDQHDQMILCPMGTGACSGGCYDPKLYNCGAGGLSQRSN